MIAFDYLRPKDLKEALEWVQPKEVWPIAGGTGLLVDVRAREIKPQAVVDIGFLEELRILRQQDGRVKIGSCLTMTSIGQSDVIQSQAPVLSQAALSLGGPQIRNRATLGGNIVTASPAADSVVALIALGAEVTLQNTAGRRSVLLEDFMDGPGQARLKHGELLTEVSFRRPESREKGFFFKLGRRNALAISVISVAIMAKSDGMAGRWESVRIALGAVAPTVLRARKAEGLLSGQRVNEELAAKAARAAASECSPISDIRASAAYRRAMVEEWVARGLVEILKRGS